MQRRQQSPWRQTKIYIPQSKASLSETMTSKGQRRERLDRTFSSPSWRTDIQTILLTSTLLTNPGLHWTFLEVAWGNFSNFLGFIILQVMVCSKEQSSLIPQYKRHRHHHHHRSQLSHKSPDLRLRRAASVGKQETRLSWSSYGPMISTAWRARTVGKLGMKLLELSTINKASQKQ